MQEICLNELKRSAVFPSLPVDGDIVNISDDDNEATEEKEEEKDFANSALRRSAKRRRNLNAIESSFVDLSLITPTSNLCERLFSKARLIHTDYRRSMNPATLDLLLFLNVNSALWDVHVVAHLLSEMPVDA